MSNLERQWSQNTIQQSGQVHASSPQIKPQRMSRPTTQSHTCQTHPPANPAPGRRLGPLRKPWCAPRGPGPREAAVCVALALLYVCVDWGGEKAGWDRVYACMHMCVYVTSAIGRSAGSLAAALGRRASIRCHWCGDLTKWMTEWNTLHPHPAPSFTYPHQTQTHKHTHLKDRLEERDGPRVEGPVRKGQRQLQVHQRVAPPVDLAGDGMWVWVCM